MTALAIERAPPPTRPLRFLLTAPLWGALAGGLLLAHGEAALLSRWSPVTVALVHAFTLGVLGNAMLGSLLQFLPVVAGVRIAGARFAPALHALYNLGVAALVAGLASGQRVILLPAAALLAATLGGFALAALAGFRARAELRLVRAGIVAALLFLLATVTIGVALAGTLAGQWAVALARWTDIHAAFGVLGWVLLLTASVGSVTMPMLQGTAPVPRAAFAAWLLVMVLALIAGAALRALELGGPAAPLVAMAPVLPFALAALGLQARAPYRRNPTLLRFWSTGLCALAAAALLLVAAPVLPGPRLAMLIGALVVAIALPWLVLGMLLEIVAFLGWIRLHRECGRGMRLPGVHALLPERDKARVLVLHGLAGSLLLAAVLWPRPWLAALTGLALTLAYAATWLVLLGVRRRADRFLVVVRSAR
ncbi:hypothetical protein [Rehaibacterium terrae]|jgi:hypothetical protein|uniref:Uncharacterized protein n=1 Tax=Rehaibacterium terrae TaxID=1341696 RepID=A0A7W8DFP5_9GAMM|nr:hypothetical protein [Rehaibacterium terrae]MBB5016414.1 hypothetical protein [Rehaibacterium terrae]